MVKKIGNIIFFCSIFLVATLFADSDRLKLSITDMNGQVVQELVRGVPYILEINVEGNYDLHTVTIPGLNALHHEFRGATRFTMMSKVSTQHNYLIRADAVGTYTLGPAQLVVEQGKRLISNTLSFSVTQERQRDVILELSTDVDRAVVGEKITLKVRLNTRVPTELLTIEQPKLDQSIGSLSKLEQANRGTVTIDNVVYEYAEWHAQLIIHKAGTLIIPSFHALCKLLTKQERTHDILSAMLHRFGGGSKPQQYFSNDLSLTIDPLPYHKGKIDGIGVFSKFSATINQQNACIGEGIVLTLTLEGKNNLDEIQAPILRLRDGLKYYESKSMHHNGANGYKKSFEYIVQGIKTGSYEIPEQEFTFFNTDTRAYETIKTQALSITIHPSQLMHEKKNELQENLMSTEFDDDDILPLQVKGPWLLKKERSLSWGWFLFLCLIPFIYFCYYFLMRYRNRYRMIHQLYLRKKYAFRQARKKLKDTKEIIHPSMLYDLFMNIFSARLQIPKSELTADVIATKLSHCGFSNEVVTQWRRFFSMIEQAAYMPHPQKEYDKEVIKRAEVWLKQLEEKI